MHSLSLYPAFSALQIHTALSVALKGCYGSYKNKYACVMAGPRHTFTLIHTNAIILIYINYISINIYINFNIFYI
jgi:hypothetical protein